MKSRRTVLRSLLLLLVALLVTSCAGSDLSDFEPGDVGPGADSASPDLGSPPDMERPDTGPADMTAPEPDGGDAGRIDMGPMEGCGDGIVQGDEECDDGNASNADACLNDCTAARCGDGFVFESIEECDDGNASNTDACLDTCVEASCGDGFVGPGEGCDDGDDDNTDACTNDCRSAQCGDGIAQSGEACDDGNDDNTDDCLNTCVKASCGDGFVGPGEACDDGNMADTDACLGDCTEARCGDGFVWSGMEECDDGDMDDTDACLGDCTEASCGDGEVWSGVEDCDDGNDIDDDMCTNRCTTPGCGDGVVQSGEECDDGDMDDSDACLSTCQDATCGDSIVWSGVEECDDGDMDDTDACLSDCSDAICGDGVVWSGVEECDDNNTMPGDGCSASCQLESCSAVATLPTCGGSVATANDAPGSTDIYESWACSNFDYTGPEIVYSITAPEDGLVEARISGLSDDLDLLVLEADASGLCAPQDASVCVDSSVTTMTEESVSFSATAGTTYFLVIEGFLDATSGFTLTVDSTLAHVQLEEVAGVRSENSFIEVINRGACTVDISSLHIDHDGTCDPVVTVDFAGIDPLGPGEIARATEGTPRPGRDVPFSVCDGIIHEPTFTLLCDGSCDYSGCSNLLDYMERDDDLTDMDEPAGPSCASFFPDPIDVGSMSSGQSVQRSSYTGVPTFWQASDWTIGMATGG
jgi:cysteine-rich repeat protein